MSKNNSEEKSGDQQDSSQAEKATEIPAASQILCGELAGIEAQAPEAGDLQIDTEKPVKEISEGKEKSEKNKLKIKKMKEKEKEKENKKDKKAKLKAKAKKKDRTQKAKNKAKAKKIAKKKAKKKAKKSKK